MMEEPFGFSFIFSIFPVLFIAVFVIVIGTFIAVAVRGTKEWHQNNQSPVLTVSAVIITKRQNYTHHKNGSSTSYYATFEVESGDRMELSISGSEYGLLAEGDRGQLTFQGSRYLGFKRM